MPIGLANTKAAKYYDVDVYEVAKYMGKLEANTRDKHLLTDSDKGGLNEKTATKITAKLRRA